MMPQSAIGISFGFGPPIPGNSLATALSAASSATQAAFSFVAQSNTVLNAVTFHVTTKNGTGGTITVNVYADANGAPNLGGGSLGALTLGSSLAANSQITYASGAVNVVRGTKYWVVIANTDASPTSNNISVVGASANSDESNVSMFSGATTTNTGGTWTQRAGLGMRFGFSDGSFLGAPVTNISFAATTNGVFAANQLGLQFKLPNNAKYDSVGLGFFLNSSGAPTGNVLFNLYDSNHTLLAATDPVLNSDVTGIGPTWFVRNFSSTYGPQTLSGGSTYTVAIAETTQSDTSLNRITSTLYTWDTDANSLALLPWSMQMDYFNGTAWAQTNNVILPFSVVLASGGEFVSSGGGAELSRIFTGF